MKRSVPLVLAITLFGLTGCTTTLPGPWTTPEDIAEKFDDIQLGMLRSEVEDILGDPSDTLPVTGKDGQAIPGSKEAWLRYKYDYPAEPLLITVKLDNFGIVTEKHLDDQESVAKLGAAKSAQDKTSYPGAPGRKFQELIKKKSREGSP